MGHDGVRAMNRPPRFAIDNAPTDGTAIVRGAELHHMRDVARLRAGAAVSLLAPDGTEYAGNIETIDSSRAVVRVARIQERTTRRALILAPAVIKGPRMDFVVEKAAELGATELWPILCARGVVRAPGAERIERWRRLALAAAKQSLAPAPMKLRDPIAFADLIGAARRDTLPGGTMAVICTIGAPPMARILREHAPRALLLACGPEGDFDEDEAARAREAGFIAAGLGPNRLRCETAAISALAIAAAMLDQNGGGE